THAREAEDDERSAREKRADGEAVIAELRNDPIDDDDERAGRAADLHTAAAQRGDEEAGDDCGVEAALGRNAGRDREGQRQRQCNDTHHHACDQIVEELRTRIALAEAYNRFRNEHRTSWELYRTWSDRAATIRC